MRLRHERLEKRHAHYLCSADGSTHTESNKLYRKVKYRYRPNISLRQRPTAKSRDDQAALAASAEARGATHRARPRSPSHSGIDEKRPTEKFVIPTVSGFQGGDRPS